MSDTPKTDRVARVAAHFDGRNQVVGADVARELERENALLRRALEFAISQGLSLSGYVIEGEPESRWRDSGCGCCSGSVTIPEEFAPIFAGLAVKP